MIATNDARGVFPVGCSLAIQGLDQLMRQVAGYDSTVLIRGESGCGKELVARRIHELSARAKGPFVPVNCGAIPRELLESELFGHEKGAFTGALTTRIGRFELADGGTLFLDEIGDMSVDMQVKLLRVLQERSFERVGSGEQRRANVRILAATHRDLEARARAGEFREDLFFRINVFPIVVPSLRERADDIPALIDDLVRRGEAEGRPSVSFAPTALDCLAAYSWPGNVRELQNLIERLAILPSSTRTKPSIASSCRRRSASVAAPCSTRLRRCRRRASICASTWATSRSSSSAARSSKRTEPWRTPPGCSACSARRSSKSCANTSCTRTRLRDCGSTSRRAPPSIRRFSSLEPSIH
jgi:sigma-54 specific flagellar transcriptional regulator A